VGLQVLDHVTTSVSAAPNRRAADFLALRKGLGYCWSVAVSSLPAEGKPLMEKWFAESDNDVRWIMRENLKKKRLSRMDASLGRRLDRGDATTCVEADVFRRADGGA